MATLPLLRVAHEFHRFLVQFPDPSLFSRSISVNNGATGPIRPTQSGSDPGMSQDVEETKRKQDEHEHGSELEPKPVEDLLVRASARPAPLFVFHIRFI
jgi:hypothetical protein